jgi:hypothetical protein
MSRSAVVDGATPVLDGCRTAGSTGMMDDQPAAMAALPGLGDRDFSADTARRIPAKVRS